MLELARVTQATFVLLGRSRLTDEPAYCATAPDAAALRRAIYDASLASGDTLTPVALSRRLHAVLAAREIRATIAGIEGAGGTARYLAVDVTDQAALASALARVRDELGPITGVVHGAGVLADKLLVDKQDEQFAAVFETKVIGLRALLAATAHDPLRLLCCFSSVAARQGNPGQADYAMANEVLNKVSLAERRRRSDHCVVKSLGWGAWDGGMVDDALKAHFASSGVKLLAPEVGAALFVREIAGAQPDQVDVALCHPFQARVLRDTAELIA